MLAFCKYHILDLLDRAGATLKEGFITSYFGRRGAVAFIVIIRSFTLSPATCFWFGALVLATTALQIRLVIPPLPPSLGSFSLGFALLLFGIFGFYYEIREMAKNTQDTSKRQDIGKDGGPR